MYLECELELTFCVVFYLFLEIYYIMSSLFYTGIMAHCIEVFIEALYTTIE
jgi:hypothetical protein